jgi:hypothetical protein
VFAQVNVGALEPPPLIVSVHPLPVRTVALV